MRVLHVIPAVAPRYGGPSTAIVSMTDALNQLPGVFAEVAATDADGATGRFSPDAWLAQHTPLHLFPRERSERWKYSSALGRWLERHTADYDIVHVHAAWSYSSAAACRAARRHRVPLIYRPCGTLSAYAWSTRPLLKWAYWLLRERANVAAAAAFHCTSEAEAVEIRAHRATHGTIHVIPLGIDPAAWKAHPQPGALRTKCGPNAAGRPIVLFLSRLHPKKGITDLLLPAFARLKTDAFLALAGGLDEHDPGYGAEVAAAIADLGLTNQVALLGPASPDERWAWFDGADVFVLPSHVENFGIVVVEALARGCPVVTCRGTATHAYVTETGLGLVPSRDVTAYAAALDELLAAPILRATALKRGQSILREQLAWPAIAGRMVEMYETCLVSIG